MFCPHSFEPPCCLPRRHERTLFVHKLQKWLKAGTGKPVRRRPKKGADFKDRGHCRRTPMYLFIYLFVYLFLCVCVFVLCVWLHELTYFCGPDHVGMRTILFWRVPMQQGSRGNWFGVCVSGQGTAHLIAKRQYANRSNTAPNQPLHPNVFELGLIHHMHDEWLQLKQKS